MAKKRRKQTDDLDLDLDFDFDKELGDIDFGGSKSEPPKNKREAAMRSVKDASKGFMEEMSSNKLKKAGELAKASIPSSLSTEFNELSDLYSSSRDFITGKTSEFKKAANDTIKAVSKILPQNKKLQDFLEKVGKKLEQDAAPKGPSKQELEQQKIQAGILGALGELKDKSHLDSMVAQTIASKQHATTAQLLQNIYAETKLQRNFQYQITNKYYRKSLELQYKHLYTAREQLELTRVAFDTFKNQLETIILNTALPDIIKSRNSELLKADIKSRMRTSAIDSFYKNSNVLKTMRGNFDKKLRSTVDGFLGGLRGLGDQAGAMADAKAMLGDSGMSKSYMVGSQLNSFLTSMLGGAISKKLGSSKKGQRAIYNIKDAFADPRAFFKEMSKNSSNKKGFGNKALSLLSKGMLGLTENDQMKTTKFRRADLNEAHPFDGRAHASITKVIPGLLSKIYGEIKANRVGGHGHEHELVFDNKSDRFMTKKQLGASVKDDFKRSVGSNAKSSVNMLGNILKEAGISISGGDLHILGQGLVGWMLQPGSATNPSMLYSEAFLGTLPAKIAGKLRKGKGKLISYLSKNPWENDSIIFVLNNIKSSLPNARARFQDIYASGHGDVLESLGVAKLGADGNMSSDMGGVANLIKNAYKESTNNNSIPAGMVGASSSLAGRGVRKKISSTINKGAKYVKGKGKTAIDKTRNFVRTLDTDNLVNYFASSKSKAEEFIEGETPNEKKRIKQVFTSTRSHFIKLHGDIEKVIVNAKNNEQQKVAKGKQKELKALTADYLRTAQSDGLNNLLVANYKKESKALVKEARETTPNVSGSVTGKIGSGVSSSPVAEGNGKAGAQLAGGALGNLQSGDTLGLMKNGVDAIKLGVKAFKERPRDYEDLKSEYFQSEEYKSGKAPNFLGWVSAMGYKMKDKDQGGIVKRMFKKAREYDRKIAGALIKSPFKAIGALFSKKSRNIGGKAMGGVGKMASVALDMLPLGLGDIIKTPFALMGKTLELVGLKEKADKKKDRKGSWLSRLNIFSKRDDDKNIRSKDGGAKSIMDKAKGLGVAALITGGLVMLNKMGISLGDIVKGVKAIGGGIMKVIKAVWGIGKWIGGVVGKALFYANPKNWGKSYKDKTYKTDPETGEPIIGDDGLPVEEEGEGGEEEGLSTAEAVGGTVALGATAYAVTHPVKTVKATVSLGTKIFESIVGIFKNPPKIPDPPGKEKGWFSSLVDKVKDKAKKLVGKVLDTVKDKFIKFIDKCFKGIREIKKFFKTGENAVRGMQKNEKIQKKVGGKVLRSVARRLGSYAAAATGIGAILTIGMLIWDLGWILWYMFYDKMTFVEALMKQVLGIDVNDPDIDELLKKAEAMAEEDLQAEEKEAMEAELKKEAEEKGVDVEKVKQAAAVKKAAENGNISAMTTAYSEKAKGIGSGKEGGWLQKKPLTDKDNKFPKYSPSPYIVPNKQTESHPQGLPADIHGLQPDVKKNLVNFAMEYYDITGKPLYINSAKRTWDQQVAMWEKSAKVKYTGNKEADIKSMKAAGGVMYGHGGYVGYPYKGNPHLGGRSVDIDWTKSPYDSQLPKDTKERHPIIDNLLEKHGLHRPYVAFRGKTSSLERWHIAPFDGAPPSTGEPDMTSYIAAASNSELRAEAKKAEKDEMVDASADAFGDGGPQTMDLKLSESGSGSVSYTPPEEHPMAYTNTTGSADTDAESTATNMGVSSTASTTVDNSSLVTSSATDNVIKTNSLTTGTGEFKSIDLAQTSPYGKDSTITKVEPNTGFSTFVLEELMVQSLSVQRKSMEHLETIAQYYEEAREYQKEAAKRPAPPSPLPPPVVNIARKESFDPSIAL